MSRLLELQMMGEKPLVKGQLFFRDTNSGKDQLPPGMKLMMVCGLVAVPENFPVEGETMVQVKGFANRDSVELHTEVQGTPIGRHYGAWSLESIMLAPGIWKF